MRLSLLFLVLFSSLYALGWDVDYPSAVRQSQKDEKPILLFFTGSDWSGLAMKMKNEVLDSPVFQEKISSQFHCLEIDFPQHTKLSKILKEQNSALKERFKIEEYPLLLLLDSKEREIFRVGYLPENGEHLADELLQIVAQDTELCKGLKELPQEEKELIHLYQIAQTLTRHEAQETILAAGVEKELPYFLLEKYRHLIEERKEAAALREKLLKSEDYRIHFTMAMIDFQERALEFSDPQEVIKPLEAYLSRFGNADPDNVWRIEMMIAQFYLNADQWKPALEHAETAYEKAPQERRHEIENSLLYIRDQIR